MVVPPSPPARRSRMWLLRIECAQGIGQELRIDADAGDLSLRTDIVDGLLVQVLRRVPMPIGLRVVLQRPGNSSPHDEDRAWEAAARTAVAARNLDGDFVVCASRASC